MQIKEKIIEALETVNIPFYHIKAPQNILPPLAIWYETDSSNLFADNRVWQVNKPVTVDVLSVEDPTDICEEIEQAFYLKGICWESGGPVWDDEENIYVCQYFV